MINLRIVMVILAFLAGLLASNMLATQGFSTPTYTDGFEFPTTIIGGSVMPTDTPQDRVSEEQIIVLHDKVVLDIENAEWSTFTPTKSMMPVIDTGANAIQVQPQPGCTDIELGDIVSYESKYAEGTVIHRIVAKGEDEQGLFFIAKGDSNPTPDPGKIRCDQILRVLVAIIY